jgi:hypothetical protein
VITALRLYILTGFSFRHCWCQWYCRFSSYRKAPHCIPPPPKKKKKRRNQSSEAAADTDTSRINCAKETKEHINTHCFSAPFCFSLRFFFFLVKRSCERGSPATLLHIHAYTLAYRSFFFFALLFSTAISVFPPLSHPCTVETRWLRSSRRPASFLIQAASLYQGGVTRVL